MSSETFLRKDTYENKNQGNYLENLENWCEIQNIRIRSG